MPKTHCPHSLFFLDTRAAITTHHSVFYAVAQLRPYITLKFILPNYVFSPIPSYAFELVPFENKPGLYLAGYRLYTRLYIYLCIHMYTHYTLTHLYVYLCIHIHTYICKSRENIGRGCHALSNWLYSIVHSTRGMVFCPKSLLLSPKSCRIFQHVWKL